MLYDAATLVTTYLPTGCEENLIGFTLISHWLGMKKKYRKSGIEKFIAKWLYTGPSRGFVGPEAKYQYVALYDVIYVNG